MSVFILLGAMIALLLQVESVDSACSGTPTGQGSTSSTFWMSDAGLHSRGASPFNTESGYQVFRNVLDFGASANGDVDAAPAINLAISSISVSNQANGRCGQGCNSSTVSPAIIYFPPGRYLVKSPIIPFYFTSLVGDYNSKPTLLADPSFSGIAVIDADPYYVGVVGPDGNGVNWWTNQNNFFRSIRNFVIDVRAVPATSYGTGIHWQVGQATSLINIDFLMSSAAGTKHQGIYMENGSGGFMSDLTFSGGAFGMWISNQQFTIRNIKIDGAVSAIYNLWNWGFTYQNIQITNCQVGFDIATGGLTLGTQTAGGILVLDSSIENTGIGIRLSTHESSSLAGSVILDNVAFSGITTANIQDSNGVLLGASASTVRQWFQGNIYQGAGGKEFFQNTYSSAPTKPSTLLSNGQIFTRSRPQYNTFIPSQFVSVKAAGAKGDGVSDDTDTINNFISANAGCSILWFDAGTYLVTGTIKVPPGAFIVGEMYSTILGTGDAFSSPFNPLPVLQVGQPGDTGSVEISDLVISTTGGSQGAIGIEWNLAQSSQGSAGMWDVHIRLGGAAGTNVNSANCPTSVSDATKCTTSYMAFHITPYGSGYFENVWVWNADHDLEDANQTRVTAFSGRGILVESSTGPVWLFGTASEHHVIYQYSIFNAQNVFAGLIQTETPYFQPQPGPPYPFTIGTGDPAVTNDAWALVINNSYNIFIYGAGLYSFFENYVQDCVSTQNCQQNIALIDDNSAAVYIYQLTTTNTVNMLTQDSNQLIVAKDNIDGYANTATFWVSASSTVPPPIKPPPVSNATRCNQVQGWVKNWADTLMNFYFDGTNSGFPCLCFGSEPEDWDEPVIMEAMINYLWGSGDTDWQIDIQHSLYIGGADGLSPQTFGGGHDDALWAALGWLKWYEYSNDVLGQSADDYLGYAKSMIDFAGADRNNPACNLTGGVFWTPDSYRNTITNGLYSHASAWYYSKTQNQSYLQQAEDVFNWLTTHGAQEFRIDLNSSNSDFNQTETYQRPDGLFYDGISDISKSESTGTIEPGICPLNRGLYTYNQGAVIAAAAFLYEATQNGSYIDSAMDIIDGVLSDFTTNDILAELCDAANNCDDNGQTFKGIFMMRLQYFLDKANNPIITAKYSTWIGNQVSAIVANALDPSSGDITNVWFEKTSSPNYGPHIIGMAISAGNIASKYGTTDGTFQC